MVHKSYTAAASPASLAAVLTLATSSSLFIAGAHASVLTDIQSNYFDPEPAAAAAQRERQYLPAQIGGIVGSYAFSLIVVAACLLLLAKRRRQHLTAGDADPEDLPYPFPNPYGIQQGVVPEQYQHFPYPVEAPQSPTNFSYPTSPRGKGPGPYIFPPPLSTSTLGVNQAVDQRVVALDRAMAQNQLEEMYKYVMEQDAAKQAGITLDAPPSPLSPAPAATAKHDSVASQPKSILKKTRNKPANLDLDRGSEKSQSRASSLLSALKSPRKSKSMKAISISSPIMTPMSGTFPRQESQEMSAIPPRHYQPSAPPPIPAGQLPYHIDSRRPSHAAPVTPPDDRSPESTMSIDERLEKMSRGHSRSASLARSEAEPESAVTDRSTMPLVGLPSSPKPGVNRFPTLPASPRPGASFASTTPRTSTFPASPAPGSSFNLPTPKPGSSFARSNAPTAIRTGGALPLRAYEPALVSPSSQNTKQTTFERAPLSPGVHTPWTGAPQPYTPYQPFSPVIPMTPSLVTKADRKRMKQLMPKTPTVEMVKSSDEIW
ncbi:uncharacterized protein B0I36DRAFT_7957 [Microdochium trichocladiopsis]|uniref:Uncharacterized protein n=1 Tax=Microdochium trichocladiopsis TaxID=1682393 RepID=A0A9P9BW59_9PEZI|nr:uncharacterized protein B0I36DRAFT_7957 [Microdochium trichocladiopsis]KAH7040275.1 hypothetical protein B0I36DRAFT_7957 [Microdochium trichocladiopsis]